MFNFLTFFLVPHSVSPLPGGGFAGCVLGCVLELGVNRFHTEARVVVVVVVLCVNQIKGVSSENWITYRYLDGHTTT